MLKAGGVGTGWFGYYDTQFLEHASRAALTRQNDYPLTVKNVLLLGGYLKRYYHGTYYAKAQNQRAGLRAAYDKALAEVDVLVLPTIPHLPAPIPSLDADFGEYMSRALSMINNTPQFNLTGHPAISVPCGVSDDLPMRLARSSAATSTISRCSGSPTRWRRARIGRACSGRRARSPPA